eukprot:TRINITY_DN6135_c0_g1_i1.p1 TRINITY_DN6135_c0_g1~~TRINITY_DN6135_c0_g1_i1.p1  ORF type:complete len:125 (+),score=3.82 TRINITY_DN6135_c0_g1_i1:128-502(+)
MAKYRVLSPVGDVPSVVCKIFALLCASFLLFFSSMAKYRVLSSAGLAPSVVCKIAPRYVPSFSPSLSLSFSLSLSLFLCLSSVDLGGLLGVCFILNSNRTSCSLAHPRSYFVHLGMHNCGSAIW